MPTGSRWRTTVLLDKIGQDNGEAILQATIAKAKKGDMQAADILLKRLWPPRKGAPVRIDGMPKIATLADINAAIAVIAGSMAEGGLTPEEAASASSVIEAQRRAIETIELEKRIAALEAGMGDRREFSK